MATRSVVESEGSSPDGVCSNELLRSEQERLETFRRKGWPHWVPVGCEKLAKAGFFYTGVQDEVQCFSCAGRHRGWQFNDQAILVHEQQFPDCPFVQNPFSSGNIPLTKSSSSSSVSPNPNSSSAQSDDSSQRRFSFSERPVRPTHLTAGATNMKDEACRRASFRRWPKGASVDPVSLSRAGFFYRGSGDTVQCAFCGGRLQQWMPGDCPLTEHRSHFPECAFAIEMLQLQESNEDSDRADRSSRSVSALIGAPSGSVGSNRRETASSVEIVQLPSSNPTTPVARPNNAPASSDVFSRAAASRPSKPRRPAEKDGDRLTDLGIITRQPTHAHMATYYARLESFDGWNPLKTQTPHDMAQAGFFYVGGSDNVKCFYCDGGLRNWVAGDVPWEEHGAWFPHCNYVRLSKGDAWVQLLLTKRASPNNSPSKVKSPTAHTPGSRERPPDRPPPKTFAELADSGVNMEEGQVSWALDMGYGETQIVQAIVSNRCNLFTSISHLIDRMEATEHRDMETERSSVATPETETLPAAMVASTSNRDSNSAMDVEKGAGGTLDKLLRLENQALREQRTCKICMDAEVAVVVLACGHLCCCATCAPALKHCPLCRRDIKGFVRAYFS